MTTPERAPHDVPTLRTNKPVHNHWLRKAKPDLPEHLYWRTLRFPPRPFALREVTGLILHSYVARAQRPPGILARSTTFDCPLWMRVLITEGVWTGNQVLCFVTPDIAPHVNPTPSDYVGLHVALSGRAERERGYWYTAYLHEPYTARVLDRYTQDW